MHPAPRRRLASSIALAATALASAASGHGGIPRGIAVHVDPTNSQRIAVQSDDWGVMVSSDGGSSFSWSCAQAYGEESAGLRHPSMSMLAGGSLVVARGAAGLFVSSVDACSWRSPTELSDRAARDLDQAPDGSELWVLTATLGANGENALFRSTDGGDTFAPLSSTLPSDVVVASIATAWGAGGPTFVAGVDAATATSLLLRADDPTSTWQRIPLDSIPPEGTLEVWVHPTDPRLVLLRLDRPPSSPQTDDGIDTVYGSTDGGDTFSLWLDGVGGMPGLALSPDGATLALAGPRVGLWTAEVSALIATGRPALGERTSRPTWGLGWTDGGLYAGLDDFDESQERSWLGRWSEATNVFEPVTSICDVQPATCPAGSTFDVACVDVLQRLGGFEQAILLGPRCAPATADGGVDGGVAAPPALAGGCACGVAGSGGASPAPWSPLLALPLLRVARRRRRQGAVQT